MLHGSETWPVRKENAVAHQRAKMKMVRWMCNLEVKDRVPSKEMRERLGTDDILEMWANAPSVQRRKVWLTPTTRMPYSNAAKTRNLLKFAGVPQTRQLISAASGPKFTIF